MAILRTIPVLLLGLLHAHGAFTQECSGGRYYDPVFPIYDSTMAVIYGSNIGVNGQTQTLRMDVWEPAGDSLYARPVVVVAYGGSFISGSRQDVALLCKEFAKRGYVAVAPDYRTGFFLPNSVSTLLAVMRGTHDMKACVRYLRRSVSELGDPYRIDTQRIIIGGVSAGAISALHATYLDQEGEMPAPILPLADQLGGIEGNSGSPGFSSDVAACFSMSGVIGDTAWIEMGDQPLASIHEEGDPIVPYYTEEIVVFSQPTGLVGSGGHDIHVRMENLGNSHCFLGYPGNGHVGYLLSDLVNSTQFIFDFCANVACGLDPNCGINIMAIEDVPASAPLRIHPNPASDQVTIDAPVQGSVSLMDMNGRLVLSHNMRIGGNSISIASLPAGIYLVTLEQMPHAVHRLVKVD